MRVFTVEISDMECKRFDETRYFTTHEKAKTYLSGFELVSAAADNTKAVYHECIDGSNVFGLAPRRAMIGWIDVVE